MFTNVKLWRRVKLNLVDNNIYKEAFFLESKFGRHTCIAAEKVPLKAFVWAGIKPAGQCNRGALQLWGVTSERSYSWHFKDNLEDAALLQSDTGCYEKSVESMYGQHAVSTKTQSKCDSKAKTTIYESTSSLQLN